MTPLNRAVIAAACLTLVAIAQPQTLNSLKDFALIGPSEGFAWTYDRILWTADSGLSWFDIGPRNAAGRLDSVSFHTSSEGWALLSIGDDSGDAVTVSVAHTTNRGADWSISPIPLTEGDSHMYAGRGIDRKSVV